MFPYCCEPLSCVRFFSTPWIAVHQTPLSMGFSRQEYWSGLPFPSLLRGIFLIQGSNPGLLHRRQILCCLSYQGPVSRQRLWPMSELSVLESPGAPMGWGGSEGSSSISHVNCSCSTTPLRTKSSGSSALRPNSSSLAVAWWAPKPVHKYSSNNRNTCFLPLQNGTHYMKVKSLSHV